MQHSCRTGIGERQGCGLVVRGIVGQRAVVWRQLHWSLTAYGLHVTASVSQSMRCIHAGLQEILPEEGTQLPSSLFLKQTIQPWLTRLRSVGWHRHGLG